MLLKRVIINKEVETLNSLFVTKKFTPHSTKILSLLRMHNPRVRDITAWRETVVIYDFWLNVYDIVYSWPGLYKDLTSARKISAQPGVVRKTTLFLFGA